MSITHVKAAYAPGAKLSENGTYHSAHGPAVITPAGSIPSRGDDGIYMIAFKYIRVNSSGYGASKIKLPALILKAYPHNSIYPIVMPIYLEDKDEMPVIITMANIIDYFHYSLGNMSGKNGNPYLSRYASYGSELGMFRPLSAKYDGYADLKTLQYLTDAAIKREENSSDTTISAQLLNIVGLKTSAGGAFNARTPLNGYRAHIVACMQAERERSGAEVPEVSYYQYQWAMISGEYLSHAEAKQKCFEGGYTWITFENGYGTEETT